MQIGGFGHPFHDHIILAGLLTTHFGNPIRHKGERQRKRERSIFNSSYILILWTIFKAKSLLGAPLSRIKTSLHCCKYFFTASYKYLGNKMKQKPCPASYLVLEFKYSGKETLRKKKKIFIIKSALVHYRMTFLHFVVGFIGEKITGFCPKGEQVFYLLYIPVSNSVFVCFNEEPENRMDPQLVIIAKSTIMISTLNFVMA